MHVTHLISMNALFESRSRYERRPCSIHPDLRYHRQEAIPAMRIQLSHAQKEQELYREGSVPLHGFRSADFPGKSSRHRGMPSLPGQSALRDGGTRAGNSNQSRLRQRVSELARLFRTRSNPHSYPLIGKGDWGLNGVPPRHIKAYSLKKVFPLSATLDRDQLIKAPLVLLAAFFIASAHQTLLGESFGDWTYSVSGSEATITGYSGVGGAVDIPGVVNGISVVKVGHDSSSIFGDGNTTVTSVTIPDSVTSIGTNAFFFCTSWSRLRELCRLNS